MIINFAIAVDSNPGPGVRSMIVVDAEGHIVYSNTQRLSNGTYTNNEMAYRTLIAVLKWIQQHASEPVTVLTDQEILTRQISGERECNSDRLRPLYKKAMALLEETGANIRWIPSQANRPARLLCVWAKHQARYERGMLA